MCPQPLVSEGRGPHLGAQQASWAQVGWANALLSSTAPPVWGLGGTLPPASPDLPCLPPMPLGPTWHGGGFGLQGTGLGAQQAPQAPVGGAIALCSSPAPPGGPLPPATPDLPSLPPMPPGPTWPGWGPGVGGGNQLGSSAGSPAPVSQVIAFHSSPAPPGESLPPASPDLPRLRGANLVWPPLLLPPQSHYILPVHSGVPPISLGIRVPHQWLAGALVVGRH